MMLESIHIRRGGIEDLEQIAAFQESMAWETEELKLDYITVAQGVRHIIENPHLGWYFVVEEAGELIASMLVLKEWSDWRNGEVWWIHSLYVVPECRRRAIFTRMYEALLTEVLENPEVHGLRLYVDKRNESAMKAYEKIGMNHEHYALFEWLK